MIALVENQEMPWQMSFRGRHWYDMPGTDSEFQKLNFALWRRGMLDAQEQKMDADATAEAGQYLVNEDGERVYARLRGGLGMKRAQNMRARAGEASRRQRDRLAALIDGDEMLPRLSGELEALRLRLQQALNKRGMTGVFQRLGGASMQVRCSEVRRGANVTPANLRRLEAMLPQAEAMRQSLRHADAVALWRARKVRKMLRTHKNTWGLIEYLMRETGAAQGQLKNFHGGRTRRLPLPILDRLEITLERMAATSPSKPTAPRTASRPLAKCA